jgi:cytochrome c553
MRLFVATIALVVAMPFLDQAHAAGDAALERQKTELCAGCHGATGISSVESVPSLAGNPESFLQWQLVFFRDGRRKHEVMGALAAELSDQDIRDLGAYYSTLPPDTRQLPADPNTALALQGKQVAEQHRCANCHTETFAGKQGAARLARQREEYLVKALADYRSHARPSTGVAAMTEAAAALADDDINAVAHFLAMLP